MPQIAEDVAMTPEAVSARLEAVGVDAGPEERMKDLAAKAG